MQPTSKWTDQHMSIWYTAPRDIATRWPVGRHQTHAP